jgi:hypothetical protein
MPFIYAARFLLLSTIAFLVCLAIPRGRRYKLYALLTPIAFGFCSIATMGIVLITGDLVGQRLHLSVFSEPLTGIKGAAILLFIYFIPGILGVWFAVPSLGGLRLIVVS